MKQFSLIGLFAILVLQIAAGIARAQYVDTYWTGVFQSKEDTTWAGADEGNSLTISVGGYPVTYFVCGDTFTGTENTTYGTFNSNFNSLAAGNSILKLQSGVLTIATTATLAVPNLATDHRGWAQDLVYENGDLYVLMQDVYDSGNGTDICDGAFYAKFTVNQSTGILTYVGYYNLPNDFVQQTSSSYGQGTIQWSRTAVDGGDGYIYFYGNDFQGSNSTLPNTYVCRVKPTYLNTNDTNFTNWQFWTGSWHTGLSGGTNNDYTLTSVMPHMADSVRYVNGEWCTTFKDGEEYTNNPVSLYTGSLTSFKTVVATYAGSGSAGGTGTSSTSNPIQPGYTEAFTGAQYSVQFVTYGPTMHPDLTSSYLIIALPWNNAPGDGTPLYYDSQVYKLRFFDVSNP